MAAPRKAPVATMPPPASSTPGTGSSPSSAHTQSREQILDEYGELDRKYRLWKPELDRLEALKEIIKPWFDAMPADAPASLSGNLYTIQATPKQRRKSARITKILKFFGTKVFYQQIVEVSQAAVKRALVSLGNPAEESDVEPFFSEAERTGYRKLTAVLKSSPTPPIAA